MHIYGVSQTESDLKLSDGNWL